MTTSRMTNNKDWQIGNGNSPHCVRRGLNSQKIQNESGTCGYVGVHWLRCSFRKPMQSQVLHVVDMFFGDHEVRDWGLWKYDRSFYWDSAGVSLQFRDGEKDGEGATQGMSTLEVPGGALESLSPFGVAAFFKALADLSPRVSRMDSFFDDALRRITPHDLAGLVYELDEHGAEVRRDFTGFRRIAVKFAASGGLVEDEVDFGRRGNVGCGKYLRIYDKRLESDGENPAVRYELELSDERAHKAFMGLVSRGYDLEDWARWLGGLIATSIDFIKRTDRAGDKNLDRLERYEFWASILLDLGTAKITLEKKDSNLEHKKTHFENQYTKSMRTFRIAMGDEEFYSWLLDLVSGDAGLKPHHFELIKRYRLDVKAKADRLASFADALTNHDLRDEEPDDSDS